MNESLTNALYTHPILLWNEARRNTCELKTNCMSREELSSGFSGDNQELETVGISLSIPQEIQISEETKETVGQGMFSCH